MKKITIHDLIHKALRKIQKKSPAEERSLGTNISAKTPKKSFDSVLNQSNDRIQWGLTSSPIQSPSVPAANRSDYNRIEWGVFDTNSKTKVLENNRLGVEDAFDHTPLQPGERVAFCRLDKVAYHLSTWDFLRTQNQGKCCVCGLSNTIEIITLPGTSIITTPIQSHYQPKVIVHPGESVISLKQVPEYIGRAVIVQDYIYEVYKTRNTGTYFLRFEQRESGDPVFEGFKLVIFPEYQSNWDVEGLSIDAYEGNYVRVRGVVQTHTKWGIEILVNSPRVIEVVDGRKNN